MNYKEEIIKLINNEENKKILSKCNSRCNLEYYIKEYTIIEMDKEDKEYYNKRIKNLYLDLNSFLERIKIKNKFYQYYQKDLDEVKEFIEKYKRIYNYVGNNFVGLGSMYNHGYKRNELNKIVNEDINSFFELKGDVKKDFDIIKNDRVEIKANERGLKKKFRERKNTEALLKLYKKYNKDYQTYL